jgi:hypothetical protein
LQIRGQPAPAKFFFFYVQKFSYLLSANNSDSIIIGFSARSDVEAMAN